MTNFAVVPVTEAHIVELGSNMRSDDQAEVRGATGLEPVEGIRFSVDRSTEAVTVLADGKVIAMLGVEPVTMLGAMAMPWLLTANGIEKYKREILVGSKAVVKYWLTRHDCLVNYVDARYTKTIRWLKWLGFIVHPAVPFGPDKLPFHRFEIRK